MGLLEKLRAKDEPSVDGRRVWGDPAAAEQLQAQRDATRTGELAVANSAKQAYETRPDDFPLVATGNVVPPSAEVQAQAEQDGQPATTDDPLEALAPPQHQ